MVAITATTNFYERKTDAFLLSKKTSTLLTYNSNGEIRCEVTEGVSLINIT